MKISEVLKAGRTLISSPLSWTQGAFARDKFGKEVDPDRLTACCWDSNGALAIAGPPYKRARLLLSMQMQPGIATFNDSHTHEEVLAAWDKAIDVAQAMQD